MTSPAPPSTGRCWAGSRTSTSSAGSRATRCPPTDATCAATSPSSPVRASATRRRSRRGTSRRSWPRCGRATATTGRCRRPRRPGAWSPSGACTGSCCWRASPPTTRPRTCGHHAAPKRLPKAISTTQVERLLEAASVGGTPASLRDRALLEVLYGCGARITEAAGLDVDDLDLEGGAVRLLGKGGKERIVPVGSFARAAVEAYLVRARPALRGPGPRHTGAVPQHPRRPAVPAERVGRAARERRAGGARHATSARTRCATRSPRTCSTAAPTSASSRSCSGTRPSRTTQIYTLVTGDRLREVYAAAHPRALHA